MFIWKNAFPAARSPPKISSFVSPLRVSAKKFANLKVCYWFSSTTALLFRPHSSHHSSSDAALQTQLFPSTHAWFFIPHCPSVPAVAPLAVSVCSLAVLVCCTCSVRKTEQNVAKALQPITLGGSLLDYLGCITLVVLLKSSWERNKESGLSRWFVTMCWRFVTLSRRVVTLSRRFVTPSRRFVTLSRRFGKA